LWGREHRAVPVKERLVERFEAATPSIWRVAYLAAGVTLVIGVAGAGLMRVVDSENYPTFGQALWWAAQTVTTVGYGDIVPQTASGRIVAVVLMVNGICFLTVFTASVVSVSMYKVTRAAEQRQREAMVEHLRRLEAQIDRIEAAVGSKGPDERG
jgi:voltage-gated potassium channel